MALYDLWTANLFYTTQKVYSNPYGLAASNSISFLQYLDVSPRTFSLVNGLRFTNQVTMAGGRTVNLSVGNAFALLNATFNINPQTASSLLNFYHTATYYHSKGNVDSSVVFVNSATYELVKPGTSSIFFQGTATYEYVGIRTTSSAVSFIDSATCLKTNVINNRFIAIYIPPPSPNPGADDGHCP